MFRLGKKYRHLIHDDGCGCANILLRERSYHLSEYSRRRFLAGAGATAVAGVFAGAVNAQTPGPMPKILLRQIRLFDGCKPAFKS